MIERWLGGSRALALVVVTVAACGCGPTPRPTEVAAEDAHSTFAYAASGSAPAPQKTAVAKLPTKHVLAKSEARPQLRQSLQKPRARGLLVTELQGLKNLASSMPPNADDLPMVQRRILEDYAELERACEKTGPTELERTARQQVIAVASTLLSQHPRYPQGDEVEFLLASEYERGGDLMNARKAYYVLIKDHPSSRFVPDAYVSFGDLFFDEAESEPSKWDLARAAYTQALTAPAPRSGVAAYAWYKLAWVEEHRGERTNAAIAMDKAIAIAEANPSGSEKLAETARADRATLTVDAPTPDAPMIPSGE